MNFKYIIGRLLFCFRMGLYCKAIVEMKRSYLQLQGNNQTLPISIGNFLKSWLELTLKRNDL